MKSKVPTEALLASYSRAGSVWKTAEEFGLCGQTVHERLVKLGACTPMNTFTAAERSTLKAEYEAHADAGTLNSLAKSMGRTKQFISRQAGGLGLTSRFRPKQYLAQLSSDRMVAKWEAMTEDQKAALAMTQRRPWKQGWREIGGIRKFYRSKWEANYARYLQWLKDNSNILDWKHEPTTFWFEEIRRGNRSYLPDFSVTENDGAVHYHEVKGWMNPASATKIKRMAKYHPSVKLIVIQKDAYLDIKRKVSRMIPDWEV